MRYTSIFVIPLLVYTVSFCVASIALLARIRPHKLYHLKTPMKERWLRRDFELEVTQPARDGAESALYEINK